MSEADRRLTSRAAPTAPVRRLTRLAAVPTIVSEHRIAATVWNHALPLLG
jgi:hypothetical protein